MKTIEKYVVFCIVLMSVALVLSCLMPTGSDAQHVLVITGIVSFLLAIVLAFAVDSHMTMTERRKEQWRRSLMLIVLISVLSSCNSKSGHLQPKKDLKRSIYYAREFRSIEEADSLSHIARRDTLKWNEFVRLTNLPGEGGDASCDSIFTMLYGYSLEFK